MSNNFYPHKTINGVKKPIHRHVMEEHLGRQLEKDEHVYHINGNSMDNSLENLVVVKKNYNKSPEDRKKSNCDKTFGNNWQESLPDIYR